MALVRAEAAADIDAIHRLNEAAFEQPAEADLVDKLRARHMHTASLVAVEDGRVVGHILFCPIEILDGGEIHAGIGLGPMAVLPAYQRRGIGSQLVRAGIGTMRAAGHGVLVVLGHPQFYPRFGFIPGVQHGISCEFGVPDDVFMVLELREGALRDCRGVVRYPPEFSEV